MNHTMTLHQTILIATAILLSACTTANWYEGFRQSAVDNCNRMESSDRERCLSRVSSQKYEEYKKERAGDLK